MSSLITPPTTTAEGQPEWLGIVRNHVENLRYGVVQLVVHDGRVTQIERTEKVRLPSEREERPRA